MKSRARMSAGRAKAHQPAAEAAANALGASQPDPQLDVNSQAADERVEDMGAQQPGEFDPAAFKRDVKEAVEGMAPPATLEEADEFEESGRAGDAASVIEGLVASGKSNAEQGIKTATEALPDTSGKEPKAVSEMENDAPGPPLPEVRPASALPPARPEADTDLSGGPREIDAKMAEANVTEHQLSEANEPEFTAALDARREAQEHATEDPATYRAHEEVILAAGRVEVENAAATQLQGMHGSRVNVLGQVLGAKEETKLADQQLRDDINRSIVSIYEITQSDVTRLLKDLDKDVDETFTSEEKEARDRFESYVEQKMDAYKDDRYGGVFGWSLWLKDIPFDLPDEVNAFYRDGREQYLGDMDRVIDKIAAIVGTALGAAQQRIQTGRDEVRTFVERLPKSVRQLGEDAAAELDGRFDQLSAEVDAKRDELVDTVARKYLESRDALDTRIKELQEANKGFVSKAIDAVVGVLTTIYELGKLLLRVLVKAASVIGDILAHPIRFFGNLVDGLKGGLDRFVNRIDVHLQNALMELLFAQLGGAGIVMPKKLNFAGILDIVLQVLGLTYQTIRERLVARFGEPAVAKMEQSVDVFKTLVNEGVAGLWVWVREKLADLENLVVGKFREYIVERVVKAGISYILALLTPVGAFIKACQGIAQIVMFIVERARQIAEFVDAVLDSIAEIARGNVGAAVEKVEGALARGLSLAIVFLARLANLGGLSEKVQSIIAVVRKPVTLAVDKIIFGAADLFQRTGGAALALAQGKRAPRKEPAQQVERLPERETPVSPPAPLEVVHMREPFEILGQDHEIFTDASGRLLIASQSTHPVTDFEQLRNLHTQYTSLPATATITRRRQIIDNMVTLIKANPGLVAQFAGVGLGDPPNLGSVQRHGQKTKGFRPKSGDPAFAPLWELESEHVLSVGAVSATFMAAGLGEAIERNSPEDDYMHTVMLYLGAARSKTHGPNADNDLIAAHKAELTGVKKRLDLLSTMYSAESESESEAILNEMRGHLYDWGIAAVSRTEAAVAREHDTNRQARGKAQGTSPLPPSPQITTAFNLQLEDIEELGLQRFRESR